MPTLYRRNAEQILIMLLLDFLFFIFVQTRERERERCQEHIVRVERIIRTGRSIEFRIHNSICSGLHGLHRHSVGR